MSTNDKTTMPRPAPADGMTEDERTVFIGSAILEAAGCEPEEFTLLDFEAVIAKARELLSPTIAAEARRQAFEAAL